MTGFGEFTTAAKFRDIIKTITRQVIDTERPASTYATVTTIDRTTNTCMVTFPGETTPVKVFCGSRMPRTTGLTVRIAGQSGDRYIEDIMDPYVTDWQTPTLNSPWVNYDIANWTGARFRREGDVVRVEGLIRTTANITPPNITIFTLPAGYRPPKSILFAAWHSANGDAPGRVGIGSDGQFQFTYGWHATVQAAGAAMYVNFAYTVGFLSINCTFATS